MVRNGIELYRAAPGAGPGAQAALRRWLQGGPAHQGHRLRPQGLFIGSFNLDARSSAINTEAGLYVASPALAAQVIEFMNEGVDPDASFRLQLDKEGNLYWIAEDEGTPLRYDKDPMTTFLQRFAASFIRLLPVDTQL
jgi:cardiolipin synthase C